MQKPWSLYNKEEKLRIDDLKPEHVRIILLAIPTSRMPDWYACQEGDLHWQPIGAIPEFYEDVRQIKGKDEDAVPQPPRPDPLATPAQPARRPLFEDPPEEMMKTEPTLQMEQLNTKERRSARRYVRALNFRINGGAGKIFDCETVDVSMSGLSLERELPDWVGKSFRAELSLNKNHIKIKCTKVSETKLKIVDAEAWDVIRQWIVNW